jgi:hypothetical protein
MCALYPLQDIATQQAWRDERHATSRKVLDEKQP